jgi:broad specificity phosphatase PhoE
MHCIAFQNTNTPENPYTMPEIMDAPLTAKGREQALLVQPKIRELEHQPELVIFSPNCRALQTGAIAFEDLTGKVPFLAHEMVREETGVHICDKRRPKSRQQHEFPMIDFSLLESEDDPVFSEEKRETKLEVAERVYKFLEWLETREEKHIGVSSHSAWLLTAFNANFYGEDSLKAWFQTGELRSVYLEFVRDGQD